MGQVCAVFEVARHQRHADVEPVAIEPAISITPVPEPVFEHREQMFCSGAHTRDGLVPAPGVSGVYPIARLPLRRWCEKRDIFDVITQRPDQVRREGRRVHSKSLYRGRTVVERCVGWLKQNRRLGTRHERLATRFMSMLKLACIDRYLRTLEPSDTAYSCSWVYDGPFVCGVKPRRPSGTGAHLHKREIPPPQGTRSSQNLRVSPLIVGKLGSQYALRCSSRSRTARAIATAFGVSLCTQSRSHPLRVTSRSA